jgi:ribosome-associated protein
LTRPKTTSLTSRKLAQLIAGFASEKKAEDIVILDMRKAANFCDYFVLSSGNSDRQVQAIAFGIEEGLEGLNINLRHRQGMRDGRWVILDLGSVVAHVFDKETRNFYGLDYLWQQAKRLKFTE